MLTLLALALALPDAILNRSYSPEPVWERVSSRCAMPIPSVRAVYGALPPGMELSPRGQLAGTPVEPGIYSFTLEITDGCSSRLDQRQIRVMPAPILLAEADVTDFHCPQGSPAFPAGLVRVSGSAPGRAYSVDILSGDGQAPGTWLEAAMAAGALPGDGMALEADTLRIFIRPAKLAPGSYTARLRFSTWQGVNAPELVFRLRVDSTQSILSRVAAPPAPIRTQVQVIEAPNPQIVAPPRLPQDPPPYFPKYVPLLRRDPAGGDRSSTHSVSRSRVLPFPKVSIDEKPPASKNPAEMKPQEKKAIAAAPEKAPERTKPSAMPAPPSAKH